MKIICCDNYGRENVSDTLVAKNISEYYGRIVVEALNKEIDDSYSDCYFKLVEDDYKLYTYNPIQ